MFQRRCTLLKIQAAPAVLCAGADAGGKGGYVSQEVEALKREWSRHEAIMRAIADPSTAGEPPLLLSLFRCSPPASTAAAQLWSRAGLSCCSSTPAYHPFLFAACLSLTWCCCPAPVHPFCACACAEAVIAKNAFERISDMCQQLGLRNKIVEIAHQVCGGFLCRPSV